jgi:hypothetical protein
MLVKAITEEVFVLLDLPSEKTLVVLIGAIRQIAARYDCELRRITP